MRMVKKKPVFLHLTFYLVHLVFLLIFSSGVVLNKTIKNYCPSFKCLFLTGGCQVFIFFILQL